MVYMLAIAGGGGGGGGFTLTTTSAGGGAGGACSGTARLITPAFLLPDILYVQVGQGGYGGAAGAAGSTGANTYISYGHSQTTPNPILVSGVNAPGGGTAGTAAGGTAGGTVPTIAATNASQVLGMWFATVGIVGGVGGAGTVAASPVSITAWAAAAIQMSPGAGGGGTSTSSANFPGGVQTAAVAMDFGDKLIATTNGFLAQSGSFPISGSTAAGGDGSSGYMSWKPFFMTGGAGGSSSNGGAGGSGGQGGIGCGGGGGGAGKTAGGRGGNGGPGMALIISW